MKSSPLHAFLFVNAVSGVGVGAGRVLTSLYAVELRADAWLMGLIAGAQSLGLLLMALPAGALLHRWGPHRLFVIGSVAAACAYAVTPLWREGLWLALSTALLSLCLPARFVAMNAAFLAQLRHWGEDKAGWMRATHLAGLLLAGPGLAALLAGALGFAGAYVAVAGAALASGLLARQALPRTMALPDGPSARRSIAWPLRLLARDRALRLACLRELVGQAGNGFFAFFIVVVAIQQLHVSAAQAAMFVTVQGVTFVAALFGAGRVAQRLGAERATRGGLLLVAAAFAVLGLAADAATAWLGCAVFGLALGLVHAANVTSLSLAGERHGQGAVTTLAALAGPAGGLAGGLLGGWIGGWVGLQTVFLLMLPAFIALAVVREPAPRPAHARNKMTETA